MAGTIQRRIVLPADSRWHGSPPNPAAPSTLTSWLRATGSGDLTQAWTLIAGTRNCSSPAHHAPLALSGSADHRASVPGERDDSIEGSPAAPGDGGVLIDSVNDTASAARSNRGSGRTLPLGATKPGGYDRHHGLTAAVLVAMSKSTSEQGGNRPRGGGRLGGVGLSGEVRNRIVDPPTHAAVRAGPGTVGRARQWLTWALGLLWLLDAALQYQPYMFTRAFPNQVIEPAGQGSPVWIQGPVSWTAGLMADHIVFWNAGFATIQLLIALGLFLGRTTRLALAASIVWALGLWWLGEGLGGVLAGPASALDGLPGAVIVYALVAVLLLTRRHPRPDGSVAETSVLGESGSKIVWLVLWAAFVFETLRPANRAPGALRDAIADNADYEPAWIRSIDHWGAELVGQRGTVVSIALAVLFALIALAVVLPITLRRPVLVMTILLMLFIWVVGQDFGEIATGQGTDPNSALPLALLAACYWPGNRAEHHGETTGETV